MLKPTVAVLSSDQMFAAGISRLLQTSADVRTCKSLEDVTEIAPHRKPHIVVADFRLVSGNGMNEVETLKAIRRRFPDVRLTIVTTIVCPESLEQFASSSSINHVRGELGGNELVKLSESLLNKLHGDLRVENLSQDGPTECSLDELARKSSEEESSRNTKQPRPASPREAGARCKTSTISHGHLLTSEPTPALGTLTGISRRFETDSPELWKTLSDLVATTNRNEVVLLIGETGVGKTYLAQLVHEISARKHEPFLSVSCGLMPSEFIENELFGNAKGDSVSRRQGNKGTLMAARRGTVVLDEISSLSLNHQERLLQLIDTGEFKQAGSDSSRICHSKLILSSHHPLPPFVEGGQFRPDLHHRLNSATFVIPPLRWRKMDILLLARKFVRQISIQNRLAINEVDPDFLAALMEYPWPGNARELEHVIGHAACECHDGRLKTIHLPDYLLSRSIRMTSSSDSNSREHSGVAESAGDVVKNIEEAGSKEKKAIERTTFMNRFYNRQSSRRYAISHVALYNKLKKYGS